MVDNLQILELVHNHLEGSDKFLVELKVKAGNKIMVFIDGDQGVNVDDCIQLSRYIESKLNRNVDDYALEVSSPGTEQPLKLRRQYIKNTGRFVKVVKNDETIIEGQLLSSGEESIDLLVQVPIPGKKFKKEEKNISLTYAEIKETKVLAKF